MKQPEILTASSIVDEWGLNVALYGEPGVGKTYLISTAQDNPATAPLLIVDIEGGTRTISNRSDIAVTRPKTWKELQALYLWLVEEGKSKYKTVALDTMSHAQVLCLEHVMGKSEKPPQIQDYGKVGILMAKMIQAFVSLSKEDGINVIFSCHVRTDTDSQGNIINISPDVYPKVGSSLMSQVDTIAYYNKKKKGSKINRILVLDSVGALKAKNRTTTNSVKELIDPNFNNLIEVK